MPIITNPLISRKRSKYGNKKTTISCVTFDSRKEAERYLALRQLERLGAINDIKLQPEFRLEVNKHLICKYRADFSYYTSDGRYIVEDVKGVKTPVYRLKAKLMKALLGIEIKEV